MDDHEAQDRNLFYCLIVKQRQNQQQSLFLEPTGRGGQYTRCGTFQIYDYPRKESPEDSRTLCRESSHLLGSQPELYE
jgi:hypothetical protein